MPYESFEIPDGTKLSKVVFRLDEEQELSQIDLFDSSETFIKQIGNVDEDFPLTPFTLQLNDSQIFVGAQVALLSDPEES